MRAINGEDEQKMLEKGGEEKKKSAIRRTLIGRMAVIAGLVCSS